MTYEFKSSFGDHLQSYIALRLSHGFKLSSFSSLPSFDNFLIENHYSEHFLSREIIMKWSIQKETENKNTRNRRVSQVRQFCRYLVSVGIDAYISIENGSVHKSIPYVLSLDEIVILFKTIDHNFENRRCRGKKSEHFRYMFPVFFRLLYSCGLRNNEACCLTFDDIKYDDKIIHIHNAKNQKDRIVYLSDDTFDLLVLYVDHIKRNVSSIWLFPSSDEKKHIPKTTVDNEFGKIIKACQLGNGKHHPVPHSLRHTYTVHRVDSWIKAGNELNELLPYLSKQLGHSSIEETYYYYHALVSSYGVIKEKSRNLYPEVVAYEE